MIAFSHPTYRNHHGGELQFGLDGMLWLATGDGGGPGDPGANAQDVTSPLGKLIRIDPRGSGSDRYTVPADHCVGELRTFIPSLDGATDDASLGLTVDRPASFGVDAHGRLYVATIPGPVYRINPAP